MGTRPSARRSATAPAASGSHSVGELRPADLPHPAADRRRRSPLRGRAVRHDPPSPDRRRRAADLPRARRPGHLRRRAGAALDRLRPRLRRVGPALRQLHRFRRRLAHGRVPALRRPRRRRSGLGPGAAADRGLRLQPQRRPADVRARPRALPRDGRRRRLRRSRADRPGSGQPARQAAADRPLRAAAATRSRRSGCATRGATRSTARPGSCGSATWGRTRSRRSTRSRSGELDRDPPPNFGWSAFEGTQRFNSDQEAPGAIAPVLEYGRDGGQLLGHRRLRGPRSGARRRSSAATSTATSASASCAASPQMPRAAAGATASSGSRSSS